MTKEWWTLRIWIGLLGIILSVGLYVGGAKFQVGSVPRQITYTDKELTTTLSGIRNITGMMFISPGSLDTFQSFLGQAKHKVWLQTYEFTEKRIKDQFKNLLAQGVDIKLIMENQKFQQFQNTRKQIQNVFSGNQNFQIKSDVQMKTKYVHSKITIIDSGFLIQTANLTHSSFLSNREYFFWSMDTGFLASLEAIFAKDREGKPILKSDIHPNLVICNINCRPVIEHLISNAKSSIKIQNQYVDDTSLQTLLKAQVAKLGRDNVRIELPKTDKNMLTQAMFGKDVVHLLKKPYLHAKMLLIDDSTLLLGSMNMSANSLDNNREIGILLLDKKIIAQFLGQFEKDWK